MKNKKHIVYLGCSGFPYGLAEIQKIILISKSLVLTGNSVTIICNRGVHTKAGHPDLGVRGSYEQIDYVYTSGTPFRSPGFIKRNSSKIKGLINEVSELKKRKKNNELDYAVLSTRSFFSVLFYFTLSKIYGFKTILNYVEYFSGVGKKWSEAGSWLNDKLYDRYTPALVDAVFPISNFLIDRIQEISPSKKYFKIPGLTDFERYNGIEISEGEKYFLFCGAASYKEIVYFIIDSFSKLTNTSVFLYLVINGTEHNIMAIKEYVNSSAQKDKIKIFSKLTEKQLFTYYKNAIALLIPLRNTFQDIARFPHKTGEYLASGNPVISTNYGEIRNYFKDQENMLLADSYDPDLFAEKMQFVIDQPDVVKKIGIEGKNVAHTIFDYRARANAIDNFLDSLVQS
jgi:glycosyltransferase involved in cell wall biosynthesis